MNNLSGEMDKLKDKIERLETQVRELTTKVIEAKEISMGEFYNSNAYKLALNTATT